MEVGVQANSVLGIVFIAIVISTFLITLLNYIDKIKQKYKTSDNLCIIHTSRIENLEKNQENFNTKIDSGFKDMKKDMTTLHNRVDDIFKILPTNTKK